MTDHSFASKSQTGKSQTDEKLLGQFIPLHYHFNMLQDETRVSTFRKAIENHVRPGMNVLELGGGTGVLSYFAAKQGARVWCVERNPELAETARNLLQKNRVMDKVAVIEADAMDYLPPGEIDVVICEMLHVALLREKQLEVIESFKRRYTDAGFDRLPRFIPNSTLLAVQPLDFSFDFSDYLAPIPLFQSPDQPSKRALPLADLTPYGEIYYDQEFPRSFDWEGDILITSAGNLTAVRFVTQNLVNYAPHPPVADFWPNQFLVIPVDPPVPLAVGQSVRVRFAYNAGASLETFVESIFVQPSLGRIPLVA